MSLEQSIKEAAIEIGFDLAGVAPIDVGHDLDFARQWVEQGRGGEMNYLRNPKRHDPRQVLPSAQSVVCVGLVYNSPVPYSTDLHSVPTLPSLNGQQRSEELPSPAKNEGRNSSQGRDATAWISRYGWGRDYHKVMKRKLEALRRSIEALATGVETRVYVDTGPIVERAFARFSGIGWMGKNTCLINEGSGSWFFLGVVLTSLALRPDIPAFDRCGSCRRCIEACPTGALDQPYGMDASRCIAYLTIELKGSIPAELRAAMGVNVFGCDICQDVCPWNRPQRRPQVARPAAEVESAAAGPKRPRNAAHTSIAEFLPKRIQAGSGQDEDATEFSLFNPPLARLLGMTEDEFELNFSNTPIRRPKYRGFIRNACVAAANSGKRELLAVIEKLTSHRDPVIREHARWAAARLEKSNPAGAEGI
jgi:epoxyqueuosine reductase